MVEKREAGKVAMKNALDQTCAASGLTPGTPACGQLLRNQAITVIKQGAGLTADLLPIISTIKSFHEADSVGEYLLATATIVPGVGPAKKAYKVAKEAGDIPGMKKALNDLVKANIDASKVARESSNFDQFSQKATLITSNRTDWKQLSAMLNQVSKAKGNFGMGKGTAEQANVMGKAWVGEGYRVARDGKTLVSADGLRTYRPPSEKKSSFAITGIQANFERLEPMMKMVNGKKVWQNKVISNGHLDVTK